MEVLVVTVILALLAALVVPVLFSVVQYGHRTTCAANLHNVGVATGSYAVDHYRALPTHHGGGTVTFDTFWMTDEANQPVNLGLLADYVSSPELFYCPTQTEETSPSIAYNSSANKWNWKKDKDNGGGGGRGRFSFSMAGVKLDEVNAGLNSSFAARSREHNKWSLPRWTLLNYGNKVIYSDFVGIDGWPGGGRFQTPIRAPHQSVGCNRLFGDGSVLWADAADINIGRKVGRNTPNARQLYEYYLLLDVLP